jgi:hypothetical protein
MENWNVGVMRKNKNRDYQMIKSLENKSLNPWTLFSNCIGEESINLIITHRTKP